MVDRSDARTEALEARFALRVTARLHEGAEQVPHDISERLRVARLQAVERLQAGPVKTLAPAAQPAVATQTAPQSVTVLTSSGAQMVHGWGAPLDDDPLPWRWRLATVLPIAALLLGLWGIHVWHKQAQVQATTEVDMALLTDDLPPAAYADPGFAEYLRAPVSHPTPEVNGGDAPLQVDDLIQEALDAGARGAS